MNKVKNTLMISIFVIIIGGFSIGSLLQTDRDVSYIEFRSLTKISRPSKNELLDGTYFSKTDEYMSDQFFQRDKWVKAHILFNINVLKKTKINNVVIGKEGYLLNFNPNIDIDQVKEKSYKSIHSNVTNINELSSYLQNRNNSLCFVSVPVQSKYRYDRYPYFMNNNKEKQNFVEDTFHNLLSENVNFVDMREIFYKNKDDNFYYKTDHHWNMNGAFLGYQSVINKLSERYPSVGKPYNKEDYDIKSYSKFYGSQNRQLSLMFKTDDNIDLWYPKYELPKYKKYGGDGYDNNIFYLDNLNSSNTYATYMNGDQAETIIETNRDELPNALIFGDSFTNPVEPYLSQHFNTTRIIDLRYYKDMSLYEYIDKNNPDIVIMIMNSGDLDGGGGNLNFK